VTQPSRVARTNAAMSEATVAALVSRARAEFGSRGFAAASVERIAADVGLSKGAVYYHFTHKKGLFEAALRACHRDIVGRIETRATASPDGRQAVVDGCVAFVDIAMDRELRQVVLVDGPSVLGYTAWRTIDAEFGLGSLRAGLHAWRGDLSTVVIDALAQAVSGAVNDLVFLVAESPDPAATHAVVRTLLPQLIGGMLDAIAAPADGNA